LRTNGNFGLLLLAVALFLAVVFVKPATHSMDVRVYYHSARVLIDGRGALYGPQSGIGWPQYFRYPPAFLLLFLPFALLPFQVTVAIWTALNCAVLYFLVCALARRFAFPRAGLWWLIPLSLCGGIIVQGFAGGNVQFLIFALVAVALGNLRGRPVFSAFVLALAVSLKVWPLFFVPYVAARRHLRVAALTMLFVIGLTLLPSVYFGWRGNVALLRQWSTQEWGTGSLGEQVWFPSQSLGGVLQGYLTAMDFSRWPDHNYPHVNFVAIDPRIVRGAWMVLAAMAYAGLLLLARATPAPFESLADSLALGVLPLLQPFAHRIELVVLLWPGMLAGALLARREVLGKWPVLLLYAAVLIEGMEPLIPGGQSQRLFQAVGVDFWATCFLTAGLLAVWLQLLRREGAARARHDLPELLAFPAVVSDK